MTRTQAESPDRTEITNDSRQVGRMDQIMDRVGTSLGNGVGFLADSGIFFILFALIWAGFGVALIWSQGSLDAAWQWSRDLPWVMQGLVWVLFLPVMAALWVWETSWSLVLRLGLVISLAAWTMVIFPAPWK